MRVNTVSSLMPILLGDLDKVKFDRIMRHISDPKEYWSPYPLPSVAMNHSSFRADTVGGNLVWRGPTWISCNWYLARGLMRHGRKDLAMQVGRQSLDLLKKSDVREYYNPFNGIGHGAEDFSWTTILLDLVIELTTEET